MRQTNPTKSEAKQPPGPGFIAALKMTPDLTRDALGTMSHISRTYGDLVRVKIGPMLVYLLNHPDYAKHVLQDNHTNYRKSSIYHEFSVLLGDGQLTTNDMEYWRSQRKLIHPAFSRAHLERYFSKVSESSSAMLERWEAAASAREPLDVYREFMRLLLGLTGKILFSIDLAEDAPQVSEAMRVAFDFIMKRVNAPIKLPRDFPTPARNRVGRHVDVLNDIVRRLIDERRQGEDRGDLLTALVRARDEAGKGMSDEHLRDEIKTLLVAGHESPANILSWACYLLSLNPDKEERLAAEIDQVVGNRPPTFADLPRLRYCQMVIEETMRLYPPAWVVERTPIEDDEIGGFRIEAGARVTMFMYEIHRHRDFWEDPERFEPERFSEERSAGRHRFSLFPFSGGPRICLGKDLSMVEMIMCLTMVIQRFRLRLEPSHPVVPLPSVNLRPRDGIVFHLAPRRAAAVAAG
ncbi:cytochrome P450 [Pyxidicoccus sp. 3LG]